MGRFLAFLADALAATRALVELVDALGRRRGPADGGPPAGPRGDAPPAPVELAPVDGPEGQPLREPGGPPGEIPVVSDDGSWESTGDDWWL